jgi:hypothetical protein
MMLIYQGSTPLPGTPDWDELTPEQQGAVYAGYQALNATPGMEPGQRMDGPETATTVRVKEGSTLTTDGPFAETKEALGGYFFFEAENLQTAIEVAAKVPAAAMGGAVEVREVVER